MQLAGAPSPQSLLLWVLLVSLAPPPRCINQPGLARLHLAVAQSPFGAPAPTAEPADIEQCKQQEETQGYRDIYCGLKWAIWNTARVPEFWVVHEVQFYWDDQCRAKFPPGLAKSSPTNEARLLRENVNTRAWDKDESTYWVAQCNVLLHGCAPWSHYIGLQISSSAAPLVLDPLQTYASLRCVRLLQSANATRMTKSIATSVWVNDTAEGMVVLNEYHDLSAGFWNRRPAAEAGLWRIWNSASTSRPWQVAELLFYSDLFCEREVFGVPISSDSFGVPQSHDEETYCYDLFWGCPSIPGCPCDPWLARYAFDGIRLPGYPFPEPLPGIWKAPCHPFLGCEADEAWIGIDLNDQPRAVNCIRIFQPTHEGWPDFGYPHFSPRLTLEGWTGFQWQAIAHFSDVGHGNWSDTRPKKGMAWRLSNFDRIPLSWEVYEMAFFEDENCGNVAKFTGAPGVDPRGIGGTSIDSNPALRFSEQEQACRLTKGSCSNLAFDQELVTAWVSDCSPCLQREAWIGLLFRQKPYNVRCFRLLQSADLLHRSEAIELSMWDGDQWVVERFEGGVGGGSWNYRPSNTYTAWRLLGTSETVEPWTVAGLHLYADRECSGAEIEAEPISVGSKPAYPIQNAFDFDPDGVTEWVVSCAPPRPGSIGCAQGSAWLGLQSKLARIDVKCVRLKQHRLRAKQMKSAYLQVFDGIRWVQVPTLPAFLGLGGGSWQTLPGAQASMWRVAARPIPGGFGVGFSEVGFYRRADCTGNPIRSNFPNVAPISSGHMKARELVDETGYTAHLTSMGDAGVTDPGMAFDGDFSTFWCDLDLLNEDSPSDPWTGWVGMDMTSQVSDVQCVRFAPAPVISLQPSWAELQGWDGRVWTSQALVATKPTLVIPLPFPSTGGWQRRPAPVRSMWRIENAEPLESWEVIEAEFYERIDCGSDRLVPMNSIGSARSAGNSDENGGHFLPGNAFDQDLETRWGAYCPSNGCQPGQAWVGMSFQGSRSIKCIRIYQSGRYERQARIMTLSTWLGDHWEGQAQYSGLGGNSWNMRPAAPDTLWRLTYMGRADEECVTTPTRPVYHRSWGVTEFELYADDECTEKLEGQAIASGSWEDTSTLGVRVDNSLAKYYSPDNANDGDDSTFWSANCRSTYDSPRATCVPGEEWLGLDIGQANGGMPVEVRCVRVHQSRALQRMCCDPAVALRLDRWNGSSWAETTWRHLPEGSTQAPVVIEGGFVLLGQCPSLTDKLSGKIDGPSPGIWEQRARRQSDTCEVPVSGAIKLLSDQMCQKHPACLEAGFAGVMFNCCPLDGGLASKCCCDIPRWKIFEDQWELGIDRKPLEPFPVVGIEYVIIQVINVMPWLGIMFTVLFCLIGSVGRPRNRKGLKYRLWNALCGPLSRWMDGNGLWPMVMRFLLRSRPEEKIGLTVFKRFLLLLVGFLIGGSLLWMCFAALLANVIMRVMMLISLVIRFAKSPYEPKEPSQKKRLMIVLAIPFNADSADLKKPDLAALLGGLAQGALQSVVALIRAICDVILLRFAFMNMGAVDLTVTVPDIMDKVPRIALNMEWLTTYVYEFLSLAGKLFTEAFTGIFEGVPRCEGPVLTFSGMWLVAITVILLRFLNYDYFGLLMSVKQTVTTTRPLFQKGIAVSVTLGFQSGTFMFMQLVMLMFSRALSLLFGVTVYPVKATEGWNCPYEGETMSILIGRLFLIIMGALAMLVTFLCANGHFLGRAPIVSSFGKQCKLDLSGLDPDADTDAGKLMRWEASLCMFPTTLGLWFDSWNIQGYLIEERARVYADQLRYPKECEYCGGRHIPYEDVMRATSMQISLAWQLFPFIGPLLGKLAEHTNNPPLFYRGTRLKCMWPTSNISLVSEHKGRKMDGASTVKHYFVLLFAYVKDRAIPILQRAVRVGMYCAIVYFTYNINKNNLERMGLWMFQVVMLLASLAGYLEALFPLLALLALAVAFVLVKKSGVKPKKDKFASTAASVQAKVWGKASAWPLIGQVVHGVSLGGALSVYLLNVWRHDRVSLDYITLTGAAAGIASGYIVMVAAWLLEQLPGSRLPANFFFWTYSIGVALFIAFYAGHSWGFGIKAFIAVVEGVILIYISGMAFRPPEVDGNGVVAPSAVWDRLTKPQAMAGPFGIYVGVFAVIMPYDYMVNKFGTYNAALACAGFGYGGGLLYAFGTNTLCERRPGQYAIGVGTIVTILVGVLFHWVVGTVMGSVAATAVGSLMENRLMKEVNKMSLEPPRYTKSKVMSSQTLMKRDPDAGFDNQVLGPPTIVRAETPTKLPAGVDALLALGGESAEARSDQQQQQRQQAVTSGEAALALALAEGGIPGVSTLNDETSAIAGENNGSRVPTASYGRASRKRYGLGSTVSNIVAPQGTPGYVPGSSRWEGPPTQDEVSGQFLQSPSSPASGVSASEVLSAAITVSPAQRRTGSSARTAPQSPTSPQQQRLRTRSTAGADGTGVSPVDPGGGSGQVSIAHGKDAVMAEMAATLRQDRQAFAQNAPEFRATKQSEEARQKQRAGEERRKKQYRAEHMEAAGNRAVEDASLAGATGLAYAVAGHGSAQGFQ